MNSKGQMHPLKRNCGYFIVNYPWSSCPVDVGANSDQMIPHVWNSNRQFANSLICMPNRFKLKSPLKTSTADRDRLFFLNGKVRRISIFISSELFLRVNGKKWFSHLWISKYSLLPHAPTFKHLWLVNELHGMNFLRRLTYLNILFHTCGKNTKVPNVIIGNQQVKVQSNHLMSAPEGIMDAAD